MLVCWWVEFSIRRKDGAGVDMFVGVGRVYRVWLGEVLCVSALGVVVS